MKGYTSHTTTTTTTHKLVCTTEPCRGSRPSWAQLGAGYSNQMQFAQGRVLVRVCTLVQSAIGYCSLLLPVPKMVLNLCNLNWWCFSHQLAQIHNLHSWWPSPVSILPMNSNCVMQVITHLLHTKSSYLSMDIS